METTTDVRLALLQESATAVEGVLREHVKNGFSCSCGWRFAWAGESSAVAAQRVYVQWRQHVAMIAVTAVYTTAHFE